MDHTVKILEVVQLLKTKPALIMYAKDHSYESLRIYIEGFLFGIRICTGIEITKNITRWFQDRIGETSNTYFTYHITTVYENLSEQEQMDILLSTIEEYLQQYPNWYIQA